MSKKKFMQMAGVKSEEEFYRLFPSEEAFFNAYPEARKMAQGGDTGTFSGGVYFPDGGTYDMSYDDMVDYLDMLPQFQMGAMMYATGGDIPAEDMVPTEKAKAKKEKFNLPFFNPYAYYKEVNKNPKDFMIGLQRAGKPVEEPAAEQPTFKHGGLHKYQNAGTYPYNGPYAPPPIQPTDPSDPFGMKKMLRLNNQSGSTSINQSPVGTTAAAQNANQNYNVSDPFGIKNILSGNNKPAASTIVPPYRPDYKGPMDPNAVAAFNPNAKAPVDKKSEKPKKSLYEKANRLGTGLDLGFGLFSYVDDLLQRKRMNEWQYNQQQAENISPIVPQGVSGSRGDYVTNTGAFRPDEYVVNKGMYTDQNPGLLLGQMGGIIPDALDMPFDMIRPAFAPSMIAGEGPGDGEPGSGPRSGVNVNVDTTWKDISSSYQGVKNYGIWGDKSHQARKSDHNTGDALDIGIKDIEQGNSVAEQLVQEAKERNIKYIIFNRRIWDPEKGWHTYVPNKSNGNNPHTTHVHVSFNRNAKNMQVGGIIPEALDMPAELITASGAPSASAPMEAFAAAPTRGEGSIAVSHNNPGNIHFGKFTSQWGAAKGAPDSDGNVAIFKSLDDGIEAMKKLLFGPAYNNLTIAQARNKWVTGQPHNSTNSTKNIVQAMGGDRKLSELSEPEKIKLISEFVKWEDGAMYKKLKSMNVFQDGGMMSRDTDMMYEEGGVYEMSEDELNQFLAMGGNVEFM